MTDEWGVGGPDRRSSTDVDHSVGIAGNHVCRLLSGAYLDDGAVLEGKSRDGAIGPGAEQDHVAPRQLEETLDVRCVFRALRAFPRHAPVQTELTAPTDGAHDPYIGHWLGLPALLPAVKQRDELAPPDHSITPSADESNLDGTSSPSVFAVFKLIANSNLVGCTTGKSAGFSPLRMRAM